MPLSKNLRREPSISITVGTTTFNAPGIYYPPYGKSVFLLSGKGSPGNATVPGNVSGDNSYSYSTYVPASGGNYAGTNPAVPGNYVSTNPTVPGNPGNLVPAVPGNRASTIYDTVYYAAVTEIANGSTGYVGPSYSTTYVEGYTLPPVYELYGSNPNQNIYLRIDWTETSSTYNPATPAYYNTNPATPGNANYNPATPAADYNNPIVPASYNVTPVPGNPNFNPDTPGNVGTTYSVLGVPLPGGAAGTAASVIGSTTVSVAYSNSGVPISVPPGGYVAIQNKRPGT